MPLNYSESLMLTKLYMSKHLEYSDTQNWAGWTLIGRHATIHNKVYYSTPMLSMRLKYDL